MQDFRAIKAWQMAHQITLDVYTITETFPKSESFGLVMQMRRAALNPPMRIAEACGQDSVEQSARALSLARAAQVELEYLFLLSRDLGLVQQAAHDILHQQLLQARKTLSGFKRAVESRPGGARTVE